MAAALLLDFSKAFYSLQLEMLLKKLHNLRVFGNVFKWLAIVATPQEENNALVSTARYPTR